MKHFRLVSLLVVAALPPACSVYNDDLIGQATGKVGDGDGDGDGDIIGDGGGDSGGAGSGGGTGSTGSGGGDGDGGTGSAPSGGGGSSGGETGGGGSTDAGGSPSGGMGGIPDNSGSCPEYSGSKVITPDDLIDDMSLGGRAILTNGGRKGDWLAVHGTDMETIPALTSGSWPSDPMEAVPGTSNDYALHYQATKIGDDDTQLWQRFGFLLLEGSPYDLSGYAGVLFCARRAVADRQSISVELTEGDQDPMNDVAHPLSGAIVPEEWAYIEIPFPASIADSLPNTKTIWFVAPQNGIEYDIWIDNIYLYKDP